MFICCEVKPSISWTSHRFWSMDYGNGGVRCTYCTNTNLVTTYWLSLFYILLSHYAALKYHACMHKAHPNTTNECFLFFFLHLHIYFILLFGRENAQCMQYIALVILRSNSHVPEQGIELSTLRANQHFNFSGSVHKAHKKRINPYYLVYNSFPFSTKCNMLEQCWCYGNCYNKTVNIHEFHINISYWQWFTSDVDKLLWTQLLLTYLLHTATVPIHSSTLIHQHVTYTHTSM